MAPCIATTSIMRPSLPLPADRIVHLKRGRSPSLSAFSGQLKSSLKSQKRLNDCSPRSTCEMVAMQGVVDAKPAPEQTNAGMPGCEGLRNAMLFLQNSRQHAMLLMMQNHWDRAMNVLEKVENASDSVCSQRRKLVLAYANQATNSTTATALASSPVTKQRNVRFQEDVQVVDALEMDRTAAEIQSPVREEMLVLRASRAIPRENYSELWL